MQLMRYVTKRGKVVYKQEYGTAPKTEEYYPAEPPDWQDELEFGTSNVVTLGFSTKTKE